MSINEKKILIKMIINWKKWNINQILLSSNKKNLESIKKIIITPILANINQIKSVKKSRKDMKEIKEVIEAKGTNSMSDINKLRNKL